MRELGRLMSTNDTESGQHQSLSEQPTEHKQKRPVFYCQSNTVTQINQIIHPGVNLTDQVIQPHITPNLCFVNKIKYLTLTPYSLLYWPVRLRNNSPIIVFKWREIVAE